MMRPTHSLTRPTRSHHQIRGRSIGRSAAASNLRKRNNVMLSSHHYSARSLARVCGQPGGVQPALRGLGSFAARNRGRTEGGTEGGADGGPSDANNLNQHHPISLKLMIVRGSCVRRSVRRSVGLLKRGHHLHHMTITVELRRDMRTRAQRCIKRQRVVSKSWRDS